MSERVTVEQAAALLSGADRVLILTHQYPDGDTLGSGFGLCLALQAMGKQARVMVAGPLAARYRYMAAEILPQTFAPAFVCAVDVADAKLLSEEQRAFADRVDLCIDHHSTHREYARSLLLDGDCAATTMLVYAVIEAMDVPLNRAIAECIYTGLSTDTGCFKYSSTTAEVFRLAASLVERGIRTDMINRLMFDLKSRPRMELERLALASLTYFFEGRCAVMTITNEMMAKSGAQENETEGLASIPRQIEGVWVGVTMREKAAGGFKISVRSDSRADSAAICHLLGGGGHLRAAGCSVDLPGPQARERILEAVRSAVKGIDDPGQASGEYGF